MARSTLKHSGIAVALAWPDTFCKQPNSWYDGIMRFLGINKDYYYQAGHAAVLLIEKTSRKCLYFDFGRYHSPFNFGRVRSVETDHELEVKAIPIFSEGLNYIQNISEILIELQSNKSCHGDGTLYASQFQIDFNGALSKAKQMQSKEFLPYGPFVKGGSNCSRFVSAVIKAGKPRIKQLFLLTFFIPFTPTPLTNVRAGKIRLSVSKLTEIGCNTKIIRPNYREWATDLKWLKETVPMPKRHSNIPISAQWLSGEGYGSWYEVKIHNNSVQLIEFSPFGIIESKSHFSFNGSSFNSQEPFSVTYPSNCKVLSIKQNDKYFKFNL